MVSWKGNILFKTKISITAIVKKSPIKSIIDRILPFFLKKSLLNTWKTSGTAKVRQSLKKYVLIVLYS